MFEEIFGRYPADDGFSMPAETAAHRCCWMGWPDKALAWRGKHHEAKAGIVRLANTIVQHEPVRMLVPVHSLGEARQACSDAVDLIPMALDDSWLRDTGPTFLIGPHGSIAGVDWVFNGWGDMEYSQWDEDKDLAAGLCRELEIPCYKAPIVNEGGAVHVDGEETLLCTVPTLMDPNRNPGRSREEIEAVLKGFLGVKKILWLTEGYHQDETGGHVDIIASFSAPGRVMHLDTEDRDDPNYPVFKKNIADLKSMTDARGRAIEVITMPQPPEYLDGGRRLDLSYQNYYPANGALIVPAFGVDEDEAAMEIFAEEFPGREIVPFSDAHILFHGGGGIHCVTQQQPEPSAT